MEIVNWWDWTYSVRKWNLWYTYAELNDNYWWGLWSPYFKNCRWPLEECEKYILKYTIVEIIDTKNIRKLRKYTGELKEELALYSEAKELEAKVNELRKARGF